MIPLVLRHYPEGREESDRALFVVFPSPRAGEAEREFRDAEIRADLHDPILPVKAVLESGRVRVRRLGADRAAFELSLVLKPAGDGERRRVETRVEAAVAR